MLHQASKEYRWRISFLPEESSLEAVVFEEEQVQVHTRMAPGEFLLRSGSPAPAVQPMATVHHWGFSPAQTGSSYSSSLSPLTTGQDMML